MPISDTTREAAAVQLETFRRMGPDGRLRAACESALASSMLRDWARADAAFATVAEEGCWGTVSFTDYLSLARINGTWKIVNKLFAHTGGEPPEME